MPGTVLVAADGVTPLRDLRADAAYRAGDRLSQEMASYAPALLSHDAAMWGLRDDVVARQRDMGRNNGWAAGARQSQIDNIIGANWMLACEPNWQALGLADMPDDDKDAFGETVEEAFDEWANDPGCWIDAGRRVTFIGLLRQAFSSWWDSGEHLSVAHWLEERIGPGRAHMATAVQEINPDRLSNPNGEMDSAERRNGIDLGAHGEPLAYWIRKSHPFDPFLFASSFDWERLAREDDFGRPIVMHGFLTDGDGMTRGVSPMTPVVEAFRLNDVKERATLKADLLNTLLAATIETQSGLDTEALETIFGVKTPTAVNGQPEFAIPGPQMQLADRTRLIRMPVGTSLKFSNPTQPGAGYEPFINATLRRIAAGLGMSFEELSRDFSKTNYSSARASLLGAWKAITGRSAFLERTKANPIYALWFEEAVDRGIVELPSLRRNGGADSFYAKRSAWLRCAWIGPGRGHVDPVKERQAYQIGRETGTDSLQSANAEQGRDWRKTARQIARETRFLARLGVALSPASATMGVQGRSDHDEAVPEGTS